MIVQKEDHYIGYFVGGCMFSNQLLSLMKKNNITKKKLSQDIGIGINQIKYWETHGSHPKADVAKKIADYFGVSVDDLKADREQKKTVTIESDGLDELDMKFISTIKQLSEQEKRMLLAQMEALIRLRGQ
jgi:transcriptional regulator with XRE-family HTH domain